MERNNEEILILANINLREINCVYVLFQLAEMKMAKNVPERFMNPAQVEKLEPEPEPNI